MVVDEFKNNMSGTIVRVNKNNKVLEVILKKNQNPKFSYRNFYKTVNIYKFSKESTLLLSSELDDYIRINGTDDFYEAVIRDIVKSEKEDFYALFTNNRKWIEIDDKKDLSLVNTIFGADSLS